VLLDTSVIDRTRVLGSSAFLKASMMAPVSADAGSIFTFRTVNP